MTTIPKVQFYSLSRDSRLAEEKDEAVIRTTLSEKFNVAPQKIELDLRDRTAVISNY